MLFPPIAGAVFPCLVLCGLIIVQGLQVRGRYSLARGKGLPLLARMAQVISWTGSSRFPGSDECINKCDIHHGMLLAIKRNKLLICTKRMNLESILLSGIIPLIWHSRKRGPIEIANNSEVARSWEWEEGINCKETWGNFSGWWKYFVSCVVVVAWICQDSLNCILKRANSLYINYTSTNLILHIHTQESRAYPLTVPLPGHTVALFSCQIPDFDISDLSRITFNLL